MSADEDHGQVGTNAAEVYDSLFVPALFGRFAEAVAGAAQIERTDQVVDVACGSGALTRAVRSRTTARVVGIDVNPGMLAVARRHGGDIEYAEGDGQDLPFATGEFDVAACQFGVMFYPDPARGLTELARVGGRGALAVWDAIDRSDGYVAMQELFRDELSANAAQSLDAPFAMGKARWKPSSMTLQSMTCPTASKVRAGSTRSTSGSQLRFGDGRSATVSARSSSRISLTWPRTGLAPS